MKWSYDFQIKEGKSKETGNTSYHSVVISDVGCAKAEEAVTCFLAF